MTDSPDAHERFFDLATRALAQGTWQRLLLAGPRAGGAVQRVTVRPIELRGQARLQIVSSEATRDLTQNLAPADGLAQLRALIGPAFRNAHLLTAHQEVQLRLGKQGKAFLSVRDLAPPAGAVAAAAPASGHDRAKTRWIAPDRPFLHALGITTAGHEVVPAMARKWKQINKFVEILAAALARSRLADAGQLRVVDFGAGKAYLTFAVHDWLVQARGIEAQVTGVELRGDLVAQGQRIATELGLRGMALAQGDLRTYAQNGPAQPMDVMIALHACDTATDHAIHLGLRAGAELIVCSPCCHKQLRPQLLSPHPLRSVFQHGIHAEQQAEMLTDSLRALLLQAQGYDTQVFEFVSLEHTAKNKMILAVKRHTPLPAAERSQLLEQAEALKAFFGIREQALQVLLGAEAAAA